MTQRLPLRVFLAAACTAGLTTACTALSVSGGGGWNEAERARELARASSLGSATSAGSPAATEASAGPAPAIVGAAPLDLATALDLASRRNRSIAAADASVNAAAGEVAAVRAALLPTAGVRGNYSWYSDEQTNSIALDPALFPPGTTLPKIGRAHV